MRRSAAATAAAMIALAGSTAVATAASPSDPALCGQHVGGVTVSEFINPRACPLYGPGTFTIAPGGSARLRLVFLHDDLVFLNEGGTGLSACSNAALKINPGTVFENAGGFVTGACNESPIKGTGLFQNDSGADFLIHSRTEAPFLLVPTLSNEGTITAQGAVVSLPSLTNLSDGTLSDGSFDAEDGGSFVLAGQIVTNDATIDLDASAALSTSSRQDALSTLTVNNGVLGVASDQPTGPLYNKGTLRIGPGATLLPSGPTTLSGSGALHVGISASGAGTLRPAGPLSVDGELVLEPAAGFAPALGETFRVADDKAGISGTFSSVSGLDLPDGDRLRLDYTATSILLTVVPAAGEPVHVTGIAPSALRQGTVRKLVLTGTGFAPDALVVSARRTCSQRGRPTSTGTPWTSWCRHRQAPQPARAR